MDLIDEHTIARRESDGLFLRYRELNHTHSAHHALGRAIATEARFATKVQANSFVVSPVVIVVIMAAKDGLYVAKLFERIEQVGVD